MASISLTLPVSGTQITAGLHATNYGTIQTAINGGLDNTNIASGAAIAPSKLAGYPSDSSKFLRGDGLWAVLGAALGNNWAQQAAAQVAVAASTTTTIATIDAANYSAGLAVVKWSVTATASDYGVSLVLFNADFYHASATKIAELPTSNHAGTVPTFSMSGTGSPTARVLQMNIGLAASAAVYSVALIG